MTSKVPPSFTEFSESKNPITFVLVCGQMDHIITQNSKELD